jgi:hypothetical protein
MPEERRNNVKRRSDNERRQIEEQPESDIYMFDRRVEEKRRSGTERRDQDKT